MIIDQNSQLNFPGVLDFPVFLFGVPPATTGTSPGQGGPVKPIRPIGGGPGPGPGVSAGGQGPKVLNLGGNTMDSQPAGV